MARSQLAALDDDPIALRSALWTGTDQAYKSALSAYAQKQAELKQVQTPPQADDFSQEKPIVSPRPAHALNLDEAAWTIASRAPAALYRTDASVSAHKHDVQYSTAVFHARAITTWLVTSEGTIVRKSTIQLSGRHSPSARRPPTACASTAPTHPPEHPSPISTSPRSSTSTPSTLIASLADLRKAPLVEEEYHGPSCSAPTPAPTPSAACSRAGGRRHASRRSALRLAPTVRLLPATTRASCPIS